MTAVEEKPRSEAHRSLVILVWELSGTNPTIFIVFLFGPRVLLFLSFLVASFIPSSQSRIFCCTESHINLSRMRRVVAWSSLSRYSSLTPVFSYVHTKNFTLLSRVSALGRNATQCRTISYHASSYVLIHSWKSGLRTLFKHVDS